METIQLEHVPATHSIHLAFFKNVTNAEFLQSRLVARDSKFEFAFIDASTVVSRLQVLTAIYKAVATLLAGNLRTPNVHSEIVISLSTSMNIAEAYRRWGVSAATKDLVVIKVLHPHDQASPAPPFTSPQGVWKHLEQNIQGRKVSFTDEELARSTDWAKVRKYYKLGGATGMEKIKDDKARLEEAEALIIGAMALRGV